MLKIKLARFGRKGQSMYRIVVNEARDKRDGKYVAKVGHYAPQQQPKVLEINLAAVKDWIKKGAQPTETVAALIKRYESGNPFPAKKEKLSKKAKIKLTAGKEDKKEEKPVTAEPVAKPIEEETMAEKDTKEEVKAEAEVAEDKPAEKAPETKK